MKKLNLIVLGVATCLGGFATLPAQSFVAPAMLNAPQGKIETTADFLAAMRKSLEIGAQSEIENLVRRYEELATWAVIELCQGYSSSPTERVENEINALRLAWNKTLRTEYVENVYEYFSLLDSQSRSERIKVVSNYQAHNRLLIKAEAAGDKDAAIDLASKFREDASALEQLGDLYFAGMAWLAYGRIQDEAIRGKDGANYDEAAFAYDKVVESRNRLDLKDRVYNDCVSRLGILKAKGATPEAGGPNAGPAAKPAVTTVGPPILAPLAFVTAKDIVEYQRPLWSNDEAFTSWTSLYLSPTQTNTTVGNVKNIKIERSGSSGLKITSGDYEGIFEMGGKFVPVEVQLSGPNGLYPWSFLAITGTSQEMYQGVQLNLEPTDAGMSVYVAPAATLEAEIMGVPIKVFDDNMSGVWGDPPASWNHIGMTKGQFQWDLDSVIVGKSKKALPWSKYQEVDGKWYDMKIDGMQLTAQEVELKTGELKLNYKGAKPNYVILQGEGPVADCYFDLTAGKTIEVPVGKYSMFIGGLSKGKRVGVQKILILPGAEQAAYPVMAEETTEVTMGGPFEFDFVAEDMGEQVRIVGQSIVVIGAGGERYERPWNNRPFPEGSLRKVGSKRGGKPEKFFSQLDPDTLYDDWNRGFFPAYLVLEKPKGATEVEVQITEKKNDLFGKLESPWKAPIQ